MAHFPRSGHIIIIIVALSVLLVMLQQEWSPWRKKSMQTCSTGIILYLWQWRRLVFSGHGHCRLWGDWGGGLGTRWESQDQLLTWSNACQWLSSEVMQFLFWGPAAAEDEHQSLFVFFCCCFCVHYGYFKIIMWYMITMQLANTVAYYFRVLFVRQS